jgi:phosphoserine phosphatase RsbU/P
VPRHCSDECAPLIDLTQEMVAQGRAQPGSLLSTLRLHAPPAANGVLGAVLRDGKPELVPDLGLDKRITSSANECQSGHSAMVGVLQSGRRKLGVFAVTRPNTAPPFTSNDFDVFSSLVEQAAFALAHAQAREEAQTKHQIEAELQNASEVQRILLPENDPPIDGWVIAGRNRAARILSGDFYDYLSPDAQRFGVVIADVSGKGLPAALVAATTRSALQAHAQTQPSPALVLNAVNRQLAPDIRQDMFVSMWIACGAGPRRASEPLSLAQKHRQSRDRAKQRHGDRD